MRILFVCLSALFLSHAAVFAGEQFLYLSAGGNVTVYQINPETGRLRNFLENHLGGAGPIGASPDRTRLYVNTQVEVEGSKKKQPGIATFAVKKGGRIDLLNRAASGMSAGYLRTDAKGRFVAGNSYGQGTAAVWKLDDEGVYRGIEPQIVSLEQKAHSAVFSPNNRFLLVPATGPNKVFQLHFDEESGKVELNDPPHADGPQGDSEARQPRHLVFHPSMPIVYTTNERERPGVGVWEWDAEKGRLRTVQNLVTYPDNFEGIITTADLHVTPDGKFLYVSNRDITDRKATTGSDSIVGFSIDRENGRLTMIGHTPCEHVPRSFDIDDTGNFLYVAGQGDNRLGFYRIDRETGVLKKIWQIQVGDRPSWVHCMMAP